MLQETSPEATPSTDVTIGGLGVGSPVVVLTARGVWNPELHELSAGVLQDCLATRPPGLIIDLTLLDDVDAQSVPVWAGARNIGVTLLPPVLVALCVAAQSALANPLQQRTRPTLLPVYASVRQAHVALSQPRFR